MDRKIANITFLLTTYVVSKTKFCIFSLVILQVQDNETLKAWQRVQQSRIQRAEQRMEDERRERDRRAEEFNQLRIGSNSLFLHAFVLPIGIKEKKRQNHENDYAYVILLANSNILERY